MRRLFLILLIALLPLRGWAAAVMSVEMLHPGSVAAHQMVESDCPDHAAMRAPSDTQDTSTNGHCSTCVACQICHSVALTGMPFIEFAPVAVASPKPPGGVHFASAQLADRVKPPIT